MFKEFKEFAIKGNVAMNFLDGAGIAARGGSVCLNSRLGVLKWVSASVMLPPGLVTAH